MRSQRLPGHSSDTFFTEQTQLKTKKEKRQGHVRNSCLSILEPSARLAAVYMRRNIHKFISFLLKTIVIF